MCFTFSRLGFFHYLCTGFHNLREFCCKISVLFLNIKIMAKNFVYERTKWLVIDSHWTNIYREFKDSDAVINDLYQYLYLSDYLASLGFYDVPDYVTYCLCENRFYRMKFRHFGGMVEIFLKPFEE